MADTRMICYPKHFKAISGAFCVEKKLLIHLIILIFPLQPMLFLPIKYL